MSERRLVFLDSSVYIKCCCDFSEKSQLSKFSRFIKKNNIRLLISEVVKDEVKKKIERRIEDSFKKIESVDFSVVRNFIDFKNKKDFLEQNLNSFEIYLKENHSLMLSMDNINIHKVWKDYSNGNPPFSSGKKKSEFPDAFNISMLETYAVENPNSDIFIISGDRDFTNIKNMVILKDISEFQDEINKENVYVQTLIDDYVREKHTIIEAEMLSDLNDVYREELIEQIISYLELVTYNSDIEDVEVKNIDIINELSVRVLEILNGNNTISIEITYSIEVTIDYNFLDTNKSKWDSIDGDFYPIYGSKRSEVHHLKCVLSIECLRRYGLEVTDHSIWDMDISHGGVYDSY